MHVFRYILVFSLLLAGRPAFAALISFEARTSVYFTEGDFVEGTLGIKPGDEIVVGMIYDGATLPDSGSFPVAGQNTLVNYTNLVSTMFVKVGLYEWRCSSFGAYVGNDVPVLTPWDVFGVSAKLILQGGIYQNEADLQMSLSSNSPDLGFTDSTFLPSPEHPLHSDHQQGSNFNLTLSPGQAVSARVDSFAIQSVPEPSSFLLLTPLFALWTMSHRRQPTPRCKMTMVVIRPSSLPLFQSCR